MSCCKGCALSCSSCTFAANTSVCAVLCDTHACEGPGVPPLSSLKPCSSLSLHLNDFISLHLNDSGHLRTSAVRLLLDTSHRLLNRDPHDRRISAPAGSFLAVGASHLLLTRRGHLWLAGAVPCWGWMVI